MSIRSRACCSVAAAALILPSAAFGQQHDADEIVVTGVLRDRVAGDIGQSITAVRGETLERVRGANLGETLASQLGVSSSYFGAGASRPLIRGLGGARVRTLDDGIDSMDAASVSDDHAVSIDPLVADQIEIFRGPTTLLYGSGAVGGVVNVVTSRIPERRPADPMAGAFELRGDTVARERSAAVRLDGGVHSLAWHLDAQSRTSDDYEIPGKADRSGVLDNSTVDTAAAALGGSWLGQSGFIGVALSTFQTTYGVPGHHERDAEEAFSEEHASDGVEVDLDQTRVDLKGGWTELGAGIEKVNLRIGVNDYRHTEREGERTGTSFTNDAYEARVEVLHRPFGPWSGAVGAQVASREFAAIGAEAFVPPVKTRTSGVFAVEELDTRHWHFAIGARIEKQGHSPSNGSRPIDHGAVSLSAAAVRELGRGYSVALNTARAERLPVAEELFSDGPHLASRTLQIGDPGLTEETASHFDVGLRKTGDTGLEWNVTAFFTRYDDFIFLRDTGEVDAGSGLPRFAFGQQDAELLGLEAEVLVAVARVDRGAVDARLFVDYVRGELSEGGHLPRMPPLRYGARFEYHGERAAAGIELMRHARQTHVAAFEEPTDGYSMLNADLLWRIETRGRLELEVFANARNIGDESARKHTSLVKETAPLPGRNYAFGVRSRF